MFVVKILEKFLKNIRDPYDFSMTPANFGAPTALGTAQWNIEKGRLKFTYPKRSFFSEKHIGDLIRVFF
jgi:hypothetical protein